MKLFEAKVFVLEKKHADILMLDVAIIQKFQCILIHLFMMIQIFFSLSFFLRYVINFLK